MTRDMNFRVPGTKLYWSSDMPKYFYYNYLYVSSDFVSVLDEKEKKFLEDIEWYENKRYSKDPKMLKTILEKYLNYFKNEHEKIPSWKKWIKKYITHKETEYESRKRELMLLIELCDKAIELKKKVEIHSY